MFNFSFLLPFQHKEVVDLPQNDAVHADKHQTALVGQFKNYEWAKKGVENASMMTAFLDGEFSKLSWLNDIVLIILIFWHVSVLNIALSF